MKKVFRVAVPSALISIVLVTAVAANILIPANANVINGFFNDSGEAVIELPDGYHDGLDLQYNKPDYTKETLASAEQALNEEIVGEGIVLLKNEDGLMPFAAGTSFSFWGRSSLILTGAEGVTLKSCFENEGFHANETLWQFYESGNGSGYGLGSGSIDYGDSEDFSINECPMTVLWNEPGLLEDTAGTVPVFVWSRKVGEGRDMPQSMYHHTDDPKDQDKSYLEPDSVELAILSYLNKYFNDVVLIVNSSAAMELGWTEEFEHIRSIIYIPSVGDQGLNALADIFSGAINPSGRTVDTFAFDAFSAPAAANYGDFQYSDESGQLTKYNYVSYKEGIYVGYRYYETRYEDVVLGQGNAGGFDHSSEVMYPFGYGMSYTTFEWSNFHADWDGDTCTVSVEVRNTGSVAGKDVVEVYAQSPYTDYDRLNGIEKSSVQLVGYEKTSLLQPGSSEIIYVTFRKEQLRAYDYIGAKTYILDAGEYYVTAAHDAHAAINNVLAAKGYSTKDGMTSDGHSDMVSMHTVVDMDIATYSVSATGTPITNQFDFANGGHDYLSRSDWQDTWPATDGEISTQISTWGNRVNGADGKPYTYTKPVSAEMLSMLDSTDSLFPIGTESFQDTPVYEAQNDLLLIDLRGKDYNDPLWNDLLDNLAPEDYQRVIAASGYGTAELERIGKPFSFDFDATTGISMGGTGYRYCSPIVLGQTWNQELAARFGKMVGNTSLMGMCNGWYAPAMNLHRLPFSGRNGEYYSEDPVLSGYMAATVSREAASKGMYTFIKHFALNDQENHRGDRAGQYGLATWANEQSIRELYLLPFQMCVENDPIVLRYIDQDETGDYVNSEREIPAVTAIMTAFNRLGCTWTGGCYPLLTNVLRGEWGFEGFVITDSAYSCGFDMNAYQIIEAGGNAKLAGNDSGTWVFDADDPAQYHYAKEAMHGILYTVANSQAMNGLMPGSTFVTPMSVSQKIVVVVNIFAVAVAVLSIVIFVWGRKRHKHTAPHSS